MENKNEDSPLTPSKATQAANVSQLTIFPKDKLLKIVTYVLIVFVLLVTGAYGHWFYQNKITNRKELIKEKESSVDKINNKKKQSETEVVYLADTCPGEKCISESAYFKRQDGSEYVFRSFAQSPERIDNFTEFLEFENVVTVNLKTKPIRVFSFMDDLDNEVIFYLTILVQGEEDINEHRTRLVKVNRNGSVLSTLWENSEWVDLATLGSGEEGKKMLFPKIKTRLSKNHLLIALEAQFSDWHEPDRLFIINTETNIVKYLGQVDISHIWGKDTFSYKKLTPVKEPCIYDGGPGPCDGEETVYRPSGDYTHDTLP